MLFIKELLQVFEIERTDTRKKGASIWTRPEPTIYGNCDSWNFIVGKKPRAYILKIAQEATLLHCNIKIIHSLLTVVYGNLLNKLWVGCGSVVD
jgi:hypothetical protein